MTQISDSLLQQLLQELPKLRTQIYFKASLTAISHAIEDLVLMGDEDPLVIANFQQERYYRQEASRYGRIAEKTDRVYVLAAPETDFVTQTVNYATIGLEPTDGLAQEWHLVIIAREYTAALICQEVAAPIDTPSLDSARQFRGFWTFDRQVSNKAAKLLCDRIAVYRPDLAAEMEDNQQRYGLMDLTSSRTHIDAELFAARLTDYLQASQFKQNRAYNQLAQLNQQLRELERAQKNLIAIVGHELRTPLSTIQICLESLTAAPDMPNEFRLSMLDTALGDAERLRKLISNFLLLSKLEASTPADWQLEPISLADAIALAVSNLRRADLHPPIRVNLPPQLPAVMVDGQALSELLGQLLDNACKFTPTTGQIDIRARVIPQANRAMVEVAIADTGRGLESSQLQTIFTRFYQTEGFLRRTAGGVGLGLAICQRIIKRLGGRMWATSAGLGCGSVFYFTLAIG